MHLKISRRVDKGGRREVLGRLSTLVQARQSLSTGESCIEIIGISLHGLTGDWTAVEYGDAGMAVGTCAVVVEGVVDTVGAA